MQWSELVRRRYSCRKYQDRPVSDETLNELLEDMRQAPSAANRQPWLFYVIRDAATRKALAEAYNNDWFYTAPVIIVACGNRDECWRRSYDGKDTLDIDVAIAVDHFVLSATDRGLGTCWIAAFEPKAVVKVLKLPPNIVPVVLSPLGYPAGEPKPKKRKALAEVVRFI